MAQKGSNNKPSPGMYQALCASFVLFSILAGYTAGIQPNQEWRFFSWHPLLMTIGMVGFAGIGAITKKLGGYTNTKLHAILGWLSIFCSGGGIYCIYRNKEINEFMHLKSNHAIAGAGIMASCVGLGLAGSIFLHPDFGIQKTNQLIRKAHKFASRACLAMAWITAVVGLKNLNVEMYLLVAYALPLLILAPMTLI